MASLKSDKADITKLYKELIIKHASNPCNFGSLKSDAMRSTGINPLCGDKLEIYISTHRDTIKKICFEGVGCAISIASASILTKILIDTSIDEAKKIALTTKGRQLIHSMGLTPKPMKRIKVTGNDASELIDKIFGELQ